MFDLGFTMREIQSQSPFACTMVWTVMAHCGAILLPEAETGVCGQHAGYGLAQESLDGMVVGSFVGVVGAWASALLFCGWWLGFD